MSKEFGAAHVAVIAVIALVVFIAAGKVGFTRDLAGLQKKA